MKSVSANGEGFLSNNSLCLSTVQAVRVEVVPHKFGVLVSNLVFSGMGLMCIIFANLVALELTPCVCVQFAFVLVR